MLQQPVNDGGKNVFYDTRDLKVVRRQRRMGKNEKRNKLPFVLLPIQ